MELPQHLEKMYGYKIDVCKDWLHASCKLSEGECFNSHSNPPLRRKPVLSCSVFNYLPKPCKYLNEISECPQGTNCRFAHGTLEVCLHPSKFCTQLCNHATNMHGNCSKFGKGCFKAHGIEELRKPLMESDDIPLTLGSTVDQRNWYVLYYKTKKCQGYPFKCECKGLDYHCDAERRRSPLGGVKYLAMPCPNIYKDHTWSDPKQCDNCIKIGVDSKECWSCIYAHTQLEIMYHPDIYKTKICHRFKRTGKCRFGNDCAHFHQDFEKREIIIPF